MRTNWEDNHCRYFEGFIPTEEKATSQKNE
jgi:hypothetical protein